jgi:hypothetical protein
MCADASVPVMPRACTCGWRSRRRVRRLGLRRHPPALPNSPARLADDACPPHSCASVTCVVDSVSVRSCHAPVPAVGRSPRRVRRLGLRRHPVRATELADTPGWRCPPAPLVHVGDCQSCVSSTASVYDHATRLYPGVGRSPRRVHRLGLRRHPPVVGGHAHTPGDDTFAIGTGVCASAGVVATPRRRSIGNAK